MTNYIVTGGAGYIGSEVVARLMKKRAADDTVIVIDSLLYGGDALRTYYGKPGFRMVLHDLGFGWPEEFLNRGPDTIILHAAGIVGEAACKERREEAERINHGLFGYELPKVSRYIFVSSCSVYGPGEDLSAEESHPRPRGDYAIAKRYGELHALAHGGYVIRPATVVGLSARQRFDTPLNNVALCAANKEKFPLFGGPDQLHPYVTMTELVDELVTAMRPESPPPRISDVCTANIDKKTIAEWFPDATEIVSETTRGFSYSVRPGRTGDWLRVHDAAVSIAHAIVEGFIREPNSHVHTNVGWAK